MQANEAGTSGSTTARIHSDFGYLMQLVNNAGISNAGAPNRALEEIMAANRPSVASIGKMRTVWNTNVFGAPAVTQALLPLLRNAPAAQS